MTEAMQRRRRLGRKRKRRPHSGDGDTNAANENDWKPSKDDGTQPSISVLVSASHSYTERDASSITNSRETAKTDKSADNTRFKVENARISHEKDETKTPSPETSGQNSKKFSRRPHSASKKEEAIKRNDNAASDLLASSSAGNAASLKNLLKQSGGLSLSEILQQQNLSLDDLLKGKQTALKALQNTASPPQEPTATITTRRLPNLNKSVLSTPQTKESSASVPRRNTFVPSSRIGGFKKPQPTASVDLSTQPLSANVSRNWGPLHIIDPPKSLVSTIPTFTTEATNVTVSKSSYESGVRRLPPSRLKPIKEVVSAIRPDLNNSGSRKRFSNFKKPEVKNLSPVNATIQTNDTHQEVDQDVKVENSNITVLNTSYIKNVLSNVNMEDDNSMEMGGSVAATSTTVSTTTAANISSTTTESTKTSLRERLRPRLRSFHRNSTTTTTTTTQAPISEASSTSSEEFPINTIEITTTTFTPISTENVINISKEIASDFDLNKKLNESTPEINLVEMDNDESRSKEVASLEELFMTEFEDSDSITDKQEPFIPSSSTSRSDKIFNSQERPNSQKMFLNSELVEIIQKSLTKLDVTERNPSLFTDIDSKIVDDKSEIMDLLGDRRGGSRLSKVLKQRNMTLDELIDHRIRGSSQLHLAEIFRNKTRSLETTTLKPNATEIQNSKVNIVTAFENFPEFNIDHVKSVKPDEIKTDSDGSSYFTSIINIQPTLEVYKEGNEIQKPENVAPNDPWNSNPDIDILDVANQANTPSQSFDHNFMDTSSSKITLISSRRLPSSSVSLQDNIENEYTGGRSHDLLDLELSGHGYNRNPVMVENTQLPIGVRSAITASASIVIVSLSIFILIFLVCRWRQSRRRKVCYSDRFQAIRGRLPILSSRDPSPSKRSTSPAIGFCSSRRSSRLNTMDPNSPEVQEYLYDAMRKAPFQ